MKKLAPLLLSICLLSPQVACAGEGKEGFFFMLLAGAGGAVVLLGMFCVGIGLAANLTTKMPIMAVLSVLVALAWGSSTYWCFTTLLNPVCWFFAKGMWSANHNTDWHPALWPWFVADMGIAGLAAALAWRQWHKRHYRRRRAEEIEASLQWPPRAL